MTHSSSDPTHPPETSSLPTRFGQNVASSLKATKVFLQNSSVWRTAKLAQGYTKCRKALSVKRLNDMAPITQLQSAFLNNAKDCGNFCNLVAQSIIAFEKKMTAGDTRRYELNYLNRQSVNAGRSRKNFSR